MERLGVAGRGLFAGDAMLRFDRRVTTSTTLRHVEIPWPGAR